MSSKRVGANMQTIPSKWDMGDEQHPLSIGMRDLFVADEGCYLAKCDLKGADGWTIGAYLAQLGEPMMLEDQLAKLKPAQPVALEVTQLGCTHGKSREQLIEMAKSLGGWQYFASKCLIWGRCLSAGHEVLSEQGWLPIESLKEGTKIATWNSLDASILFEVPSRIIRQSYTGPMYNFEGTSMSIEATSDHRMPYWHNNKLTVRNAIEVASLKAGNLPLSGWKTGGKSEPLARLVAAIMSDGHYTKQGRLVFTFRKQRKIDRIKLLLEQAGIGYKEAIYWSKRDQTNEHVIRCERGAPRFPKKAGIWMLEWDTQSISDFLNEYPKWDGTIPKNRDTELIFAVDKEHLDWIATLCRLCGCGFTYNGSRISGKGSTVHSMSLNERRFASRQSMTVTQRGVENLPVYCVTVSSSFFMVRRNNKIFVTGNCYKLGPDKGSELVFIESEGKVNLSRKEINSIFDVIERRYHVSKLHTWMARHMSSQSYPAKLVAPNGFVRKFFERNFGEMPECTRSALSHLPQVVTTHTINSAMGKCYNDPENRRDDGSLRIEPLHSVHDELVVQWRIEETEWAKVKIKEWFNNPLVIAGKQITIPYDGKYGPNWAMNDGEYVGTL